MAIIETPLANAKGVFYCDGLNRKIPCGSVKYEFGKTKGLSKQLVSDQASGLIATRGVVE